MKIKDLARLGAVCPHSYPQKKWTALKTYFNQALAALL
jgi:hypothetical protein